MTTIAYRRSPAPPGKTGVTLGPDLAGTLMTPREFDFVQDYEEGWRYEIVHGVLVVNPIPLEAHIAPNEYLGYLLLSYRYHQPEVSTLDETLPERYVRTRDSRRLADRVIWCGLGRRPIPSRDTPAIVVEFVSAGKRNRRRDYEEKRQEYREIGVVEYWVIDRFERTMTVFRRKKPQKTLISEKETYRSPLLPGFELPLGELLAVADQWEPSE